jgi:ParB family chromosome partitioning protein
MAAAQREARVSERSRRAPLGRGLAALFGEAAGAAPAAPAAAVRTVPIEAVRPSPLQPRRHFAEAEIEALAQSIREKGILQPLLVRPAAAGEARYELVAGERRWRAAQRAGLHEVPVAVREFADREALEIALVENLQREDLSALDEAEAYNRLVREFARSQAAIADAVGKSRSHVANTIRLLALPAPVRRQLAEGQLTPGHARALLGADDPAALAAEIVRRGLNVRATEALVRRRAAPPRPSRQQARDADAVALERELSTALGLRVSIAAGRRGGTLSLHYKSLDQLDRVLALLRAT